MYELLEVTVGDAATPTVTFDNDDESTVFDATGNVLVTVTNLAGTALATNAVATDATGTGVYSWPMPAQSSPDVLTLTWSGTFNAKARTVTTLVEIVGGHYFGTKALRNSDKQLGTAAAKPLTDTATWPTQTLLDARREAELEAMALTGHSCVGRACKERMVARGGLLLPAQGKVRTIRSATLVASGSPIGVTGWTIDGTWADIIGCGLSDGTVVDVIYEHGCTVVPPAVARACLVRARHHLARNVSKVPEQTERFTVTEQGTFFVALPSSRSTGNAHVDSAYNRHSCQVGIA